MYLTIDRIPTADPAKPETGWDPASGIRSVDRVFELGRTLLPAAAAVVNANSRLGFVDCSRAAAI
jgi:hypothetical protein